MDFEEIENLEEEQLNDMYNDIVDFGDESHLACCCCVDGCKHNSNYSRAECTTWCRRQGSTCSGWDVVCYSYMYNCLFRC